MRRVWAVLALCGLLASAGGARAAELRILSAGAAQAAVERLAEAHHKAGGAVAKTRFGTVGALQDLLAQGETPDLVVLTAAPLKKLGDEGRLAAEEPLALGDVVVGVAVKSGAPRPDISTVEAFRATLLSAKSIVYADPAKGATSGAHVAAVIEKLGIADAMKPKTTLLPGGYVVELVAKGGAEIGIHQVTEILPVEGVMLAGPLPDALQLRTRYVAARLAADRSGGEAAAFLALLKGPQGRKILGEAGFAAP